MEWIAETSSDMAPVPGLCTTGSDGAEAPSWAVVTNGTNEFTRAGYRWEASMPTVGKTPACGLTRDSLLLRIFH